MEDIFTKIVSGEIPCHKVYENEDCLAFLDVKPHSKGHTLVIPKSAGVSAFDFNDEILAKLMIAVKKTMKILQNKLNPDGFNVGWNDGVAAGQVVPRLHIHIFPRYNGDGGGSMHSIINNPQSSAEEVAKLFKSRSIGC